MGWEIKLIGDIQDPFIYKIKFLFACIVYNLDFKTEALLACISN